MFLLELRSVVRNEEDPDLCCVRRARLLGEWAQLNTHSDSHRDAEELETKRGSQGEFLTPIKRWRTA